MKDFTSHVNSFPLNNKSFDENFKSFSPILDRLAANAQKKYQASHISRNEFRSVYDESFWLAWLDDSRRKRYTFLHTINYYAKSRIHKLLISYCYKFTLNGKTNYISFHSVHIPLEGHQQLTSTNAQPSVTILDFQAYLAKYQLSFPEESTVIRRLAAGHKGSEICADLWHVAYSPPLRQKIHRICIHFRNFC